MRSDLTSVERFIAEHALHSTVPVDLAAICDLYDVQSYALDDGLMGFTVRGKWNVAIGVNSTLDDYTRRAIIAHEAAHVILDHPNSLYVCRLNGWLYHQYEREAQQAAAAILVPKGPLLELVTGGATVREMAVVFEVPEDLVEIRLRLVRAA